MDKVTQYNYFTKLINQFTRGCLQNVPKVLEKRYGFQQGFIVSPDPLITCFFKFPF